MKQPEVALGEVAEVVMGQSPEGEHYNQAGEGLPLITGAGQFGEKHPQPTQFSRTGAKISEPGDIIICVRATIGDLNWADREYFLGRGVAAIRPHASLNANYAWWMLEASKRKLEGRATGSTFKQIKKEDLVELSFPLPPLPEQQRIAEILDQAEALRAKRRQALVKLDSLSQSLFVDLFGQPTKNEKGWSIKPLGDYLRFLTSGGRGWAEFYTTQGSRFIRSLDVQMNYIGDDDIVYVKPPDNAEARRTRVETGDVLLTITGSKIGRVAPVGDELAGSHVSQHVSILRLNMDALHPLFVSFFLSLDAGGQRQIAKAQYGQTKPGLNFDQIRRFELPIPPINVQRDFVQRYAAVDRIRKAQSASASKFDALFASLQYRAFQEAL